MCLSTVSKSKRPIGNGWFRYWVRARRRDSLLLFLTMKSFIILFIILFYQETFYSYTC